MPHQIEQPTLFELNTCDEFEPPLGLAAGEASPSVTPKSDSSNPEANVCPREPGVFSAVSPWAGMPLDFEFVPLSGIAVFFVYALRRVSCKRCGVQVEAVPWATGKHTLTTAYVQFLALWARRLAWSEVATMFHTSSEKVFHSVEWMVQWGLEHGKLTRIRSLGIDEMTWRKGHEYLTLVSQIAA
jgi:hypothetical protein